MHHTDDRAQNLFARLFSYVPRPLSNGEQGKRMRQRNALEDFCTEALAWCLLNSVEFSNRLFELQPFAGLGFRPNGFEVHTQQSVRKEEIEDHEDRTSLGGGRFDLVIAFTAPAPVLFVIECKVAPDKSENIHSQVTAYRQHLEGSDFQSYTKKQIILLTPSGAAHPAADSSLSWDQVHDALSGVVKSGVDPQAAILGQFADYLKLQHLAKMKLPKTADYLSSLKQVAPFLAGLDAIFASLRNDEVAKAIFASRDVNPKVEHHPGEEGEEHFWYGIWSRSTNPIYYVGFHSACHVDEPLSVSVQVTFPGNCASDPVPAKLVPFYNRAHSGREGNQTNFIFATEIDADLDGNAAAIEGWIIARLRDLKEWVDSKVK